MSPTVSHVMYCMAVLALKTSTPFSLALSPTTAAVMIVARTAATYTANSRVLVEPLMSFVSMSP